MRKSYLMLAALLAFVWVAPLTVDAQDTKPVTKAPATKTATKVAPAPCPRAEPKVTGTVTVTDTKKEEPKAETREDPAAASSQPAAPVTDPPKAEEPTQEWWETGLAHLLKLVFLILGLMATALVRVLMKKYGFEEQSGKVNDLLTKAIGFAEQKALKASKLEEGKMTSSAEKMKMAIEFAQGLAKEYKLPEKGSEWWEDKLESWLGVTGASSTNGTTPAGPEEEG